MKKPLIITGILTLTMIGWWHHYQSKKQDVKHWSTVALLQTIDHPALDDARKGFIDELEELTNHSVKFVSYNGQGNTAHLNANAHIIAADETIDLIYAIATPAALAIAATENKRPLVVAAVTDASIITKNSAPNNMCGVTDAIDIEKQLDMIQAFVPTLRSLALLYNPGEPNSVSQIETMIKSLTRRNISYQKIGISNPHEISAAITLASDADALLAPTDNLIVSAMPLTASRAIANNLPLFVCDNPSVSRGALASRGVDYYQSGKQAGAMAYDILTHKKTPADCGCIPPAQLSMVVNKTTLDALGLTLPAGLAPEVTWVKGVAS